MSDTTVILYTILALSAVVMLLVAAGCDYLSLLSIRVENVIKEGLCAAILIGY